MLYIFPDTNVFIHGKHFEEIDWPILTGVGEISIMIAPTVIDELDGHKHHTTKKIAQRVRKILPRIEEIFLNPGSCKWTITPILKRPSTNILDRHHLDPKIQDDVLLASILEFNEEVGEDNQVLLLTNDTGPKLKAFSLDIPAKSLPDDYMLPDEPDESEKKIAILQRELDLHRNKIPLVSLQFENGNNYLEIKKPGRPKSQEEFVNGKMEEIWKEFPLLVLRDNSATMSPLEKRMFSALSLSLKSAQVDLYNEELMEFFKDYEQYFIMEYQRAYFLLNCCPVSILIKNTGTVPANDIDIFMHFPDGFDIVKESDIPKKAKKPEPPYMPKHPYDIHRPPRSLDDLSSLLHPVQHRSDLSYIARNVGNPSIKKTNSYDVSVPVRSVKHNQREQLDKLWLKYEDIRYANGFTIDYRIMAANIPQVVTGMLNVNFTDNED